MTAATRRAKRTRILVSVVNSFDCLVAKEEKILENDTTLWRDAKVRLLLLSSGYVTVLMTDDDVVNSHSFVYYCFHHHHGSIIVVVREIG